MLPSALNHNLLRPLAEYIAGSPTTLDQKGFVQGAGFIQGGLIKDGLIQGGLAHDGTRQGPASFGLGSTAVNGTADQKAYSRLPPGRSL